MKSELEKVRWLGIGMLGTVLAVVACSEDDPPTPGPATSGSAGIGTNAGTSSGSSGSGNAAGGNAGTATAGNASGGTMQSGGNAGTAGALAGGGGVPSEAGAGGGTGEAGDGAAGGEHDDGGAGGQGGAPVEAIACDFTETEGDEDQPTGLQIGSAAKVLCGRVDNGHYNVGTQIVDADRYSVGVPKGDVLLRLDVPNLQALTNVEIQLDGIRSIITQPVSIFRRHTLFDAGTVIVRGYAAADVAEPIPYRLSLAVDNIDARCPPNAGTGFTEASDGPDSVGNDVYLIEDEVPSLSALATDAAESTGITLTKVTGGFRINGQSGNTPRVGDYYDGDSYAFHTAPGVTQVTVRADWAGSGRDLDLWLFKVGATKTSGFISSFSTQSGEYVTALVEPDADYIAYVGCQSGLRPFDYALTVCGEAFSMNGK